MIDKHESDLADAIRELARASNRTADLLEILLESIPATKEAELLGVSEKTVRRHREARKIQRALSA